MAFRVGQRIVCINSKDRLLPASDGNFYYNSFWGYNMPILGNVYTIRGINTMGGLYLEEIDNSTKKHNGHGEEHGYCQSRFRPVHTIESDSEMFRSISEDMMGRLEILEDVLNEQYLCDETHE